MGTRGLMGFRKNGQDKTSYNHYDSYPDGLGDSVIQFCRETSIEEINTIFDKIVLVDEEVMPTRKQINGCKEWTDLSVSEHTKYDWYCLLRNAQGDLNAFKNGLRYMIDRHDFIYDSLFCEFGYIINLDDNTLEFWRGFQKKPQEDNRYGTENDNGYYPCKMLKAYPLSSIPKNVIKKMNVLAHIEDQEEEIL